MSSNVSHIFILFILINILRECHINCQSFPFTHSINDCYHLCFGVSACVQECEQGYSIRQDYKKKRSVYNERDSDTNHPNIESLSLYDDNVHYNKPRTYNYQGSAYPSPPNCGLRYAKGMARQGLGANSLGRIVGGEDAGLHEFPWLVSLQLIKEDNPIPKHFCGAAIISNYYLLTAAHCLQSLVGLENKVVIQAGVNSLDQTGQMLYPAKFIVHEKWNVDRQVNDLSLIRLKRPAQFTKDRSGKYTVNAVCLPSDTSEPRGKAVLAGWGQLSEDDPQTADWLQKITLPIWNRKDCAVNYKKFMKILRTHICAGGIAGHDSCMGDSGGPLVQTRGERTYILGVVSFGIPCAIDGLPGVYTFLVYYMDWITNNMV